MNKFFSLIIAFSSLSLLFSCNNDKQGGKTILTLDNGYIVIDTFANGFAKTAYKIYPNDTSRTSIEIYHENGKLSMKGDLVGPSKVRDGAWKAWDSTGKIISKGSYKNGLDDGFKVVYYPSGAKYYEGEFANGKKIGEWRFYDESGKITQNISFDSLSK